MSKLTQRLLFQPTYTTEIDKLADELNICFSTATELTCGEYSFNLKMNPWQHPIFDENLHRLIALLTSLRRGCGGVVYLVTDDTETVTQEIFQTYKERLYELIDKNVESFALSTKIIQLCSELDTYRSWASLLIKMSYSALKYSLVESKGIWIPITFEMDIFGKMHTRPMSDIQSQGNMEIEKSLVSTGHETESPTLLPTYSQENIPHQTNAETSSLSATEPLTEPMPRDDIAVHQMDFSSIQRLNWSENKKDWQKFVKIKKVKTDDIAVQCPMWQPTQPMKTTPEKQSVRYLFGSEKSLEETISAVATKEPGCAVVCRTWRFHISDISVTEDLPPGHICDILSQTRAGCPFG